MAYFEAFLQSIKLSANLLFMRSDLGFQFIIFKYYWVINEYFECQVIQLFLGFGILGNLKTLLHTQRWRHIYMGGGLTNSTHSYHLQDLVEVQKSFFSPRCFPLNQIWQHQARTTKSAVTWYIYIWIFVVLTNSMAQKSRNW